MTRRLVPHTLALIFLAAFAASPALSDDKEKPKDKERPDLQETELYQLLGARKRTRFTRPATAADRTCASTITRSKSRASPTD